MAKKELKPVQDFAFGKENYRWMLISLAVLLIGYLLMAGGGSEDPKIFNPDIFNFRHIILAPCVVIAGFLIGVYAVLKKTKE